MLDKKQIWAIFFFFFFLSSKLGHGRKAVETIHNISYSLGPGTAKKLIVQ